jgi:hypothetical protein
MYVKYLHTLHDFRLLIIVIDNSVILFELKMWDAIQFCLNKNYSMRIFSLQEKLDTSILFLFDFIYLIEKWKE